MAAGDFSNIRIDSTNFDVVTVRYTYGGAAGIKLYRSTDGSTYASVQSIPAAYGSYPSPILDVTVAAATYYYYKFTDDDGATFTAVYNVQTQVQFNERDEPTGLALPAFSAEADINADALDRMRVQLETYINGEQNSSVGRDCKVCPTNGALVLDCTGGCYSFTVEEADIADVNSISINCERLEVNFDVPPGTSTEICGWKDGAGYQGDECFQAPVAGPVSLPIVMHPDEPCAISRTRYTSGPCKGDYVYECWDEGSVFTSGRRDPVATDCACGSFFDGLINDMSGTYNYTIISGRDTGVSSLEHKSYAGFSLLYKNLNTSCIGATGPKILEMVIGGFSNTSYFLRRNTIGSPMFGWAVNVPEGVTIRSFTGHVLLFDYLNSRWVWGSYSGADLRSGVMPTIIDQVAFSALANAVHFDIIIDATATNLYSNYDVILESDSAAQYIAHTSIAMGSMPVGTGLFWIGQPAIGNHIAQISCNRESTMLWWG